MDRETKKLLLKFGKKLTSEFPKAKFNDKDLISFRMGIVPEDIEIDRSKGDHFILYGEYNVIYHDSFNKLRSESALEYLKDSELDNALWYFTCDIIANYTTYRDESKLKNRIDEFLSSILKPLEEYEILIPILNINAEDYKINIGDISVKKFDEKALEGWGVKKNWLKFKDIVDKTMAIVPEKGNNPRLIIERARRNAHFIIRVLQVSCSTSRIVHDIEELFSQGEVIFYRKKDTPSSVSVMWQSGYKPIPLDIDDELKDKIDVFLSKIADILEGKNKQKLRERFKLALMWIGSSIEEEDSDSKIICLSTALEAMLTTQSDGKKGETLAYRMLLLNAQVDQPFIHPAKVLWIYKLRSQIIHGSALGVASKNEYYTMRTVAIDTLIYSLDLIQKEGITKHVKFIEKLESYGESEKILDWLETQGNKGSLDIKKYIIKTRDTFGTTVNSANIISLLLPLFLI